MSAAEAGHPLADYRRADDAGRANAQEMLFWWWKFGRMAQDEREANGGKKLPDGRLPAIAEETGRSARTIQERMRFAREYPTEEKMRNALRINGWETWTDVLDSFRHESAQEDEADPEPGEEVIEPPRGQVVLGEMDPEREEAVEARAAEETEVMATRGELAEAGAEGTAPPLTVGAENLIAALLTMAKGAREIEELTKLAPAITLPKLVIEPSKQRIERPLKAALRGYSLVAAAYYPQQPMPEGWRRYVGDGVIQTRIAVPEDGVIDAAAEPVGLRLGPVTVETLERATGYLRDARAAGEINPDELQQIAEEFSALRAEIDLARAEVLDPAA